MEKYPIVGPYLNNLLSRVMDNVEVNGKLVRRWKEDAFAVLDQELDEKWAPLTKLDPKAVEDYRVILATIKAFCESHFPLEEYRAQTFTEHLNKTANELEKEIDKQCADVNLPGETPECENARNLLREIRGLAADLENEYRV